ncbi:mannitol-1-phosphate 5-dehydrogenase [Evansella caseinilytica]|uniref:Mannitol-1-phosphate 5-dehydrogenase n=1 Tax=Evansella caseinilytica TaxID=1503961 RepID=A0A1H3QA77_9BACI|nr:mannitol-1-phosphate 5-dehydrogenase [Evansella caseinilytica]SDZ10296.1 mannitol-1-phosphate 5-dehydrogenase [Evansella caseinilytica]
MQAVHFGAGNIGRGFIGKLLYDAGYQTCFIDVNQDMIDRLNEEKKYRVIYAEEEGRVFEVGNVSGIHSLTEPEKVVDAIVNADIITTAVGTNILPVIAKIIARGLDKRYQQHDRPVNIIACENAIGGTTLLKQALLEETAAENHDRLLSLTGFPNAAVDRIVPNQQQENPLDVMVEPFFEWVTEEPKIIAEKPAIDGMNYVTNLEAYIERKLFTVNTGHAVTAYLGYMESKQTIKEALEDRQIYEKVMAVLQETGKLICRKYHFHENDHQEYIAKIISRFTNPFIVDEVTRVARTPIKKLGYNERFISPARQLLEQDIFPKALVYGIFAVLHYNYENDPEAVSLQAKLQADGIKKTLSEVSGLTIDSPIVTAVEKLFQETR